MLDKRDATVDLEEARRNSSRMTTGSSSSLLSCYFYRVATRFLYDKQYSYGAHGRYFHICHSQKLTDKSQSQS